MTNRAINTLVVLLVMLVVAAAGYYQVEVKQPEELQHIEDAKKLARLKQAELEQLFVEEATSSEMAQETMRRWRARYKYIPARLTTPEIIAYLESLSSTGFEQFKYKLSAQGSTPDYSYYLFEVSGTAYYESLYQFIWQIENNREFFYHVSDLDMAHTNVFKINETTRVRKRLDMVNFSMKLKVLFAGTAGLSAPQNEIVDVPEILLPEKQPPHDSYFPIIRTDLPPNDELRLDVENATILSIAGGRAIFEDKNGQHIVREGDEVYLGQIVKIDPVNASVRAVLNKAGLMETVDVSMDLEGFHELARQKDVRLIPADKQ